MILRLMWAFTKLRIAKKTQANLRDGLEIYKKHQEVNKLFLTAQRVKNREQELYLKGQLDILKWVSKQEVENDEKRPA